MAHINTLPTPYRYYRSKPNESWFMAWIRSLRYGDDEKPPIYAADPGVSDEVSDTGASASSAFEAAAVMLAQEVGESVKENLKENAALRAEYQKKLDEVSAMLAERRGG